MHRPHTIELTARALVVGCSRLLVVSDDGEYWSAGRTVGAGETLLECAAREVAEETGLLIGTTDLLHVGEFVEVALGTHEVECYFLATVRGGQLARTGSMPAAT